MVWIFEIKDKSGRKIHISQEQWSHIQKHPEMVNKIEQIKETLQNPDKIQEVDYDSKVRFYYRYDKERREYLFISGYSLLNVIFK